MKHIIQIEDHPNPPVFSIQIPDHWEEHENISPQQIISWGDKEVLFTQAMIPTVTIIMDITNIRYTPDFEYDTYQFSQAIKENVVLPTGVPVNYYQTELFFITEEERVGMIIVSATTPITTDEYNAPIEHALQSLTLEN